jgi:hypothetical protein
LITLVLILVLVLADAIVAVVTGLIGRARGHPFWLWAILGFVFPILAVVAVVLIPRRRR